MIERRWSLAFSIAGGVLLVAATSLLVTISLGRGSSSTTDASGRLIEAEYSTPSIMQNSPRVALGWIAASLVIVTVLALLIRYGGVIGAVLVMVLMWLMVMASILTIGIFLAPGAGLLTVAAVVAIADRANRHRPAPFASPY